MACACGNADQHVIGRRPTADGKHVLLWDDGSLTWALGFSIKGSAAPRTPEQRRRALSAGWMVLGDACLYDASELPSLIQAARWASARTGDPKTMRDRFATLTGSRGPTPEWTILSADRNGRPTLRVWVLPRLLWGGLAVWHERGRYSIMRSVRRDDVYEPTGFTATTLREVIAILPQLRASYIDSKEAS